jgi:hypothetical protein
MAASKDRPTYTVEAIPSDVNNGVFLGSTALDNVISCVVAMGAELWATKRRLLVMEAVMQGRGITPEMIEKFVPSAAQAAAWEKERDRYIDLTLAPLSNEGFRTVGSERPER